MNTEEYKKPYNRLLDDVLLNNNCIREINGKRTMYLSAKAQLKLFDMQNVIDYVTEEDLKMYNDYCIGKPCSFCCEEYNTTVIGIVDKITLNKDKRCFDIHFSDYVFDYHCDSDDIELTVDNDIVIHAESINNLSIMNSYEGYNADESYDEDNKSLFIMSDSDYYDILDEYIDCDLAADKEYTEDVYKSHFNDDIDNGIELWDDENNCLNFHPDGVDIIYNNFNDSCDTDLTKNGIKELSEYYKDKIVSFCDGDYDNPDSVYFGKVKHIKMNQQTKEITLYMDHVIIYDENDIVIDEEDIVLDKRFNKALLDKNLLADMNSYKNLFHILWTYYIIKEETIYEDYKKFKKLANEA